VEGKWRTEKRKEERKKREKGRVVRWVREKKEEWCVGLGRKGRRRKEMGSVREREWSTG
jgi:hypothetical protein